MVEASGHVRRDSCVYCGKRGAAEGERLIADERSFFGPEASGSNECFVVLHPWRAIPNPWRAIPGFAKTPRGVIARARLFNRDAANRAAFRLPKYAPRQTASPN